MQLIPSEKYLFDFSGGYVYYSFIKPQTHILPHCGPTNLKIRCHIPIFVPDSCTIRVGNEIKTYVEAQSLFFDDSFEQEIWNDSNEILVILVLDFWNTKLVEQEIAFIKSFPFLTTLRYS